MLDYDIVYVKSKQEFDDRVSDYFVNMTNNARTLHKTYACHSANMAYRFIAFDTLEDVAEYEKLHRNSTPFKRCGNCFK
ncbi:MAG: hypothetical protein K2K90_16550 [Lachnospiraceae bacterium]|nr:hypothetical protein [Lachnospiraceae bacterium]